MRPFHITRRALGALALALPLAGLAQEHGPLEWVVGYAAGGGSDAVARIVAEDMARTLGRTIIVNNKPGAATNIAAEYVARSKNPSQVIFTADFATLAANPFLFGKLPYDAARDFQPVGMLGKFPLLLVVGPAVPAQDIREFMAWLKAAREPVSFASAGIGSPQHLAGELFKQRTDLPLQHVPYRGAAPALQDILGGQVPFGLLDSAAVTQHLAGGKLRALAVASRARLKTLPDVPTLEEGGVPDFEAFAWQGLVVPAGADPAQARAVTAALQQALGADRVKARLQAMAVEPMPGMPADMTRFVEAERARWGALIQAAHITLD